MRTINVIFQHTLNKKKHLNEFTFFIYQMDYFKKGFGWCYLIFPNIFALGNFFG